MIDPQVRACIAAIAASMARGQHPARFSIIRGVGTLHSVDLPSEQHQHV